ncbi:MAG: chain-length determining protein [Paracoccaceae bacterium]|jgi:uncharacterized protein involved in exopolysaccharide biosynthesis|nr:chain-length determining protein [Paracoccaceae bacterium]MDP7185758.1 chain-length determining protein [Paracoccaceae bacterium]
MHQFEIFSGAARAFSNRIVIMLMLFIVGIIATIVYTIQQPQVYRATAVIQIESPQISEAVAGSIGTSAAHRLQLIEQRMMARDNLAAIIDRHGLFTDDPDMSITEKVNLLRESISTQQIAGEDAGIGAVSVPAGLIISVQLEDPNKAADLANDLVNTVIEQNDSRRSSQARETLAFFEAQEGELLGSIERLEARIAEFKQVNAEVLPETVTSLIGQEADFQSAILDIDQQIVTLRSGNSRQRAEFVDRQVAILDEQKMLLTERLLGVRSLLQRAPAVERELAQMSRELGLYQGQYDVVTANRAEAELSLSLEDRKQAERFEILETALPPEYPVSTSRRMIFLIGAVLSLVGSGAIIFFYGNLSPIVRNARDLKDELDLTPVVTIPTIVSPREAFGERLVIATMLALLFIAIPLVTLQIVAGG